MEDFDIKALLIGDMNRLRYVNRYSTSMVIHRENVAEHSYYVALYALHLTRWVESVSEVKVDKFEVLMRALLHDIDECRTGDFQRPFKYSDPVLKHHMDLAAAKEAKDLVSIILPRDTLWAERCYISWTEAKDNSIEGAIIALADFMAVVSYLWQEAKFASPTLFLNYKTVVEYLKTFEQPKFILLVPIIYELREIIEGIVKETGHAI